MPCDVYTENSYFDIIKRMAEAVEANKADLVLMGVKPRNASDKFGYILPKENVVAGSEVQEVELFFENPTQRQRAAFSGWGLAGTLVSLPSDWAT